MADKTVIGTFKSRDKAEEAVDKVQQQAGIPQDKISVLAKDNGQNKTSQSNADNNQMTNDTVADGTTWGAGLGAGAGLLASAGALAIPGIGPVLAIGPIAATLSGGLSGGIAGGLLDWGIPEDTGRRYENEIKKGGVVCLVQANQNETSKVENVLEECGAQDVEVH